MAAVAITAQAILRPDSKACLSMQHNCRLNRGLLRQVPVSSHAEYNYAETLARRIVFSSSHKCSVQSCRNTDAETRDDALNLEENLEQTDDALNVEKICDVNNLEGEREMQRKEKKSELEELGEDILLFMKPIIRVLNGSQDLLPRKGGPVKSFLNTFVRTMSGSAWTESSKAEFGKRFAKAEADFFKFASDIRKHLAIMVGNGAILAIAFNISDGNGQLDTLIWSGWFAGVVAGTMIGANQVLECRCRSGPQNVVITGSTRGLGKALAREFLFAGDDVVIASRSLDSVRTTVAQLQQEIDKVIAISTTSTPVGKVFGISCDVSKAKDVKMLSDFAVNKLGSIDIWINNAGANKGFRPLMQFTDEDINQIVSTNLTGSLICTREAIRVMKSQEKGGHIFNMDGAGSGGSSTPLTAVYGATKCGLRQLHLSLLKECKRSKVGIHTASPGMVLTDLLLSGASLQNKKMFNIICELPETVARTLVPRMRTVKGTGKAVNYLTPPRILLALITAWLRRDRWFDEKGKALYAAETDRVRIWAQSRARFSLSEAMDLYSDGSWVSVFSLSVVCAFIILSSSGNSMSGT